VNVGIAVAGYVIDLRERSDRGPMPKVAIDGAAGAVIDAKPADAPAPKMIDAKPVG
jgi:hypothetical protein